MKCYYCNCKTTGSKLEIGKPYFVCLEHDLGDTILRGNCLSEDTFKFLAEYCLIGNQNGNEQPYTYNDAKKIPTDASYYVSKIPKDLVDSLIANGYYTQFIQILLKEISFEIDKMYNDSKKNYPVIYAYNLVGKRIIEIQTQNVKSWESFASFRTSNEVELAISIISDYLSAVYKHES